MERVAAVPFVGTDSADVARANAPVLLLWRCCLLGDTPPRLAIL